MFYEIKVDFPIQAKKAPFMPLSMISTERPKITPKARKADARKNSLEDIIVPVPKKCVEALTPDEVLKKKTEEKTNEETGSSIRR